MELQAKRNLNEHLEFKTVKTRNSAVHGTASKPAAKLEHCYLFSK